MKKLLVLVLALAMILSCAAIAEEETPRVGGDIVIALSYEPDTMNVYSTHLLGDVQAMVVEGLLVPNGDMQYEAVLVTEVPTVENGGIVMDEEAGTMVITYHLRDDVYWHCGEQLTSKDVLATWEALTNPDWDAESKSGVFDIDSIDCPDDFTVVCNYNKISPDYAQSLFTFGIMPAHDIEGVDMNDPNNGYNNTPCGTGPYVFSEWVAGEYIKLVRNENYYREGAYIDTVTFRFIPDENTRITMLKTGEIDFAYNIGYINYGQVENIEGYDTIVHGLNSWRYLDFNCGVPGLDDVAVRRAIACALDKDAMVDQLFSGIPQAWDQPWMPTDPFHVEGFESEWSYDVEKANAMLDEAGWVMGADGIREKDGVKLDFELITRSGTTNDKLAAQVIVSYLEQVGIKVSISESASADWSSKMYAGEYEMSLGGYITSPGATRTKFYAIGGSLNRGAWENEEFTELSHQIDKELNTEVRKGMVEQALAIFDSELPQLVLYANQEIDVVTSKLHGYIPNPTNMTNFCQSASWWLEE